MNVQTDQTGWTIKRKFLKHACDDGRKLADRRFICSQRYSLIYIYITLFLAGFRKMIIFLSNDSFDLVDRVRTDLIRSHMELFFGREVHVWWHCTLAFDLNVLKRTIPVSSDGRVGRSKVDSDRCHCRDRCSATQCSATAAQADRESSVSDELVFCAVFRFIFGATGAWDL